MPQTAFALKKFFIIIYLGTFCFRSISQTHSLDPMDFWESPKRGANVFNQRVTRNDIRAAKDYGIQFIRLAPDKFFTQQRDFLIGDADDYHELVDDDLLSLTTTLDICLQEEMPVVLTMLSLPFSRWKQNNNNVDDLTLWTHPGKLFIAARFWQDLAAILKNHPAIVAFNILNEPHPEKICSPDSPFAQLCETCLATFNQAIIQAIRTTDPKIPIIIDSGNYADPQAFKYLEPLATDDRILYSFHMYEPYNYTNKSCNNGRYSYPGCLIDNVLWNKCTLSIYLKPVLDFQKKYNIRSNRIIVGEFGGHRTSPGLEHYFQDLLDIFKTNNWHYAFYSFNEDTWDGMNYQNTPAGQVLWHNYAI